MKVSDTVMSTFKARIIAACGLAVLMLTISFLMPGQSIAQGPRDCPGVSICNTDAQPIPVRWAGTEAQPVPVQWTGTGKVEVANVDAQPIPISGGVDLKSPVSVKTSPREPIHVIFALTPENSFYAQGTLGLRHGDNSVLFSPPGFEVPAGKTLSLKHIAADIDMGSPAQIPQVFLKGTHLGGASITVPLFEISHGAIHWGISQSMQFPPLKPSTQIEILFQRNNGGGQATLTIALTGELIDAP